MTVLFHELFSSMGYMYSFFHSTSWSQTNVIIIALTDLHFTDLQGLSTGLAYFVIHICATCQLLSCIASQMNLPRPAIFGFVIGIRFVWPQTGSPEGSLHHSFCNFWCDTSMLHRWEKGSWYFTSCGCSASCYIYFVYFFLWLPKNCHI